MKRFAIFFLTILMLVLLVACNEGGDTPAVCQHRDADDNSLCDKCGESYTDGIDVTLENTPSVCQHRDADDNALCDKCGEAYTDGIDDDNVDTKKCTHQYSSSATCINRTCIINGCEHVEAATTQHEYTREYVCVGCGQATDCTLEILGQTYSEEILAQARTNAGTLTGNFEIVVLDAQGTAENLDLEFLKSSPFDTDKIVGGLFVKFEVELFGEPYDTVYYNYGLQFSEEQTSDIAFTYDGSDEIWFLEVVEGNKTILFEYSIT